MPKFEEDLILNNIPDDFDEDQETPEEEYFHEYYEQQLIDDLCVKILDEWRAYCNAVGIRMCEQMNVNKMRELLCVVDE